MDKIVTLARRPTPDGLLCPKCGASRFRTEKQTFRNGATHLRVTCAECGKFIKYAAREGEPEPRYEPADTERAHEQNTKPPPTSWIWLALIRQSDQVWRAVGTAPTLERAWDVLLHFPGEGDRLCIPSRPSD